MILVCNSAFNQLSFIMIVVIRGLGNRLINDLYNVISRRRIEMRLRRHLVVEIG
jgi:hypothetical protein